MNTGILLNLTAWIEEDGVHGPTSGDRIIEAGANIDVNETIHLGYCQEW